MGAYEEARDTLVNLLICVEDDDLYPQCSVDCPKFNGACDEPLKCMAEYILSLSGPNWWLAIVEKESQWPEPMSDQQLAYRGRAREAGFVKEVKK